jgi:hypothetical protein
MVLMKVRQETGLDSFNCGQRLSRGELENNFRKLRDLTKNNHSDSL